MFHPYQRAISCSIFQSLDQNQSKVVPSPISFFLSIDLKTIIPGSPKDIDAASFHHRSNIRFSFSEFLKIPRTFVFTGRSSRTRTRPCAATRLCCRTDAYFVFLGQSRKVARTFFFARGSGGTGTGLSGATGFYARVGNTLCLFGLLKISRTFVFSRRSGCARSRFSTTT